MRRPHDCCDKGLIGALPPWLPVLIPARPKLPQPARRTTRHGGPAGEPPQPPQPAPITSKATSKRAAQAIAVTSRLPGLAVSGLCTTLSLPVSVPTPTAVAGGLVPMISTLIRSLADRTRDSQTLNCDQPRVGFEPPTRAKAERKRSVLPSPVDRYCLHLAHHPGRTDGGPRSELTRPRRAATLGSRLDPPAARPAGRMRGRRHQHGITLHVATLQNGSSAAHGSP